jgi:hypothetical protein
MVFYSRPVGGHVNKEELVDHTSNGPNVLGVYKRRGKMGNP